MKSCSSNYVVVNLTTSQLVIEVFASTCCNSLISRVLLTPWYWVSFIREERGIGKNNVSRPESVMDWILGRQSSGLLPKGQVIFLDFGSTRILNGTFRI